MKANLKNGWRVERPEKVLTTKFMDEEVRVAYVDNDWYFVLDDIGRAIMIKESRALARDIPAKWMKKVCIPVEVVVSDVDSTDVTSQDIVSGGISSTVTSQDIVVDGCNAPVKFKKYPQRARKNRVYIAVNSFGVFEAMGRSRKLEARQFREWTYEVLDTLRKKEGIATYNLTKLTEKETQDQILDHIDKAKYEGWDMYYDKVTDWWWIEKMTGGGDITFVPVDDPYGRPFKWLEYDPTYEPSFDTNDPDIKRPCPYYN